MTGCNMLDNLPLRIRVLILAVLAGLMIFGGFQYSVRIKAGKDVIITGQAVVPEQEKEEEEYIPKMLTVHVVGAVEKPGVYTLEEGKRIDDAVVLAVPTEKADLSLINLAAALQDGKQIYVPKKGEKPENIRNSTVSSSSAIININTAGAAELDKLPGIGPALAQRIIDYRENIGSFSTIEDITKVSGIGPAMFEKMKSRITVN